MKKKLIKAISKIASQIDSPFFAPFVKILIQAIQKKSDGELRQILLEIRKMIDEILAEK